MDERSSKAPDIVKSLPKTNRSVPRGLLHREVGFKEKQGRVSTEFQLAAEDQLVLKNHEELVCHRCLSVLILSEYGFPFCNW